jgi:hypothetical protein
MPYRNPTPVSLLAALTRELAGRGRGYPLFWGVCRKSLSGGLARRP